MIMGNDGGDDAVDESTVAQRRVLPQDRNGGGVTKSIDRALEAVFERRVVRSAI
jgi:hypothetical protein